MLKLCTFNIKNDFKTYNSKKATTIIKFIKEKDLDILCFQELFSKCSNDIEKSSEIKGYNLYGNYRYKLKILDFINEKTAILTNKKVEESKTYRLPYFPSGLKRVATKIIIDTKDLGKLTIINTHLDYQFSLSKKRQLKRILKIIKQEKYPVILTGDFNLKNNNPIFNGFKKSLEQLDLNWIEVNEKTLKQSKYKRAIDHIFISKKLALRKLRVIKNLDISDHYPIFIEIEKAK